MEKYIYIDDEEVKGLKTISRGFVDTGLISIEIIDLSVFNSFEKLGEDLKKRWDEFDGILLDLRLNGEGVNSQNYTATTLAQFLRSFCADEERSAKPIVLWSTDFIQHTHYSEDFTSHDLFDYVFEKSEKTNWDDVSAKMESLAQGYKFINSYEDKDWSGVLNRKLSGLLESIFSQYEVGFSSCATIASLILGKIMSNPGILVNEAIMASRLGIDRTQSHDWGKVLDIFKDAKYMGVFNEMGEYYWSDKVIEVYKNVTKGARLASLLAADRVDLLKKNTGIEKIVASSPIPFAESTMFWTVDEKTNAPLDPLDGFVLKETMPLANWQEPRYVSFNTINEGLVELKQLLPAEKLRYVVQLEDLKNDGEEK